MKVKATRLGIYGGERKKPGDVFDIARKGQFSKSWMREVVEKVEEPVDARDAKKAE